MTELERLKGVLAHAEENGDRAIFEDFLAAGTRLGLHARPYKLSVMFTPPTNWTRMLFTIWTEQGVPAAATSVTVTSEPGDDRVGWGRRLRRGGCIKVLSSTRSCDALRVRFVDRRGEHMAILMTAEVPGFTAEMADGMNAQVGDQMKRAPGFVIHTNGPAEGGWRVTEVWESEGHFNRWYEETVQPNLPPGVTPQVSFHQLHDVLTAG